MAEIIVKQFDSTLEFLEWASNAPCLWKGRLESREESSDKTRWTGTKDYNAAYELARYGWQEGLEKLAQQVELAAKLSPPTNNRKKRYDVAGDTVNPGRAAVGEPFNMATRGRDFKQKPVIKIRVNFGYAHSVETEKVMRWGAAICSYVDQLERAGFSTQLDAFSETSSWGPSVSFQFPLKRAGQPLSLSNVVFWWAHPSSLRRIEFSAMERLDIERWYSNGYGHPTTVTAPEPGALFLTIGDARDTMEECLDVIRSKHRELLKGNPDPSVRVALQNDLS